MDWQLPSSPLLSQTCHQHWEWSVHILGFSFFMDVKNWGKSSLCVTVLQVQGFVPSSKKNNNPGLQISAAGEHHVSLGIWGTPSDQEILQNNSKITSKSEQSMGLSRFMGKVWQQHGMLFCLSYQDNLNSLKPKLCRKDPIVTPRSCFQQIQDQNC